jgi:hypothetical protein
VAELNHALTVNCRTPPLLTIESPFPEARSMLRLLEVPDICQKSLWERVFDGTYDRPFIVDSGSRRYLHFDLDAVQSAMHLEYPDRLCLAYTRKMMAFLLFNHAPERILLLGLGGGSLAKFCYRRLPCSGIVGLIVVDEPFGKVSIHVSSITPAGEVMLAWLSEPETRAARSRPRASLSRDRSW